MTKSIDKEFTPVNIPLSGKCITAVDPSVIGLSNFRELVNLRPGPTNPEPILGMTKINTAALANVNITTGIQFIKDDPTAESHVIVHARDSNNANGKVYRNSAVVPAQGAFTSTALFSDSAGAGTPRFSMAPLGMVTYCNGTDSVIWPGLEGKCAGYIDYNPDNSWRFNYTRQVTNDLTDSNNIATVHRHADTVDADTMLLLHLDNNVTDSSPATVHTVTNTNVTFSTSVKKFGTHGAYFDGTAYLSVPDNADFDFSGGAFAVDKWVRYDTLPAAGATATYPIYYQQTDANNYISLYLTVARGAMSFPFVVTTQLHFKIVAASAEVVSLSATIGSNMLNTWMHVQVCESADNFYLFANGSLVDYASDTDRAANYTGVVYIGYDGTNYFRGYMDECRVSDVVRKTAAFEPATLAYGQGNVFTSYVAASLPAQGINWYVQTANTTAGTAVVSYWNGSSWVTVGTITGVGATPFSATGKNTWTFASTAAVAKPKIIDGGMAYWYKVEVTEVDTTTQFYKITPDCPMQTIRDMWDGTNRRISSFQKYQTNIFNDLTVNVFKEDWDSSNTATFAEIDSLPTTTGFLYFGFTERQQGIRFALIGGHVNTTAGTTMMIEYWDGSAWINAGTLDDGTVEGGISFAKSGLVTWNAPELASEFETNLPGSSRPIFSQDQLLATTPAPAGFPDRWRQGVINTAAATGAKTVDRPHLYYYRVSFSQNLSGDVQLYFVGGVPVQRDLQTYDFSFTHLNRLWLAKGNRLIASSQDTAQVFNGDDALEFPVGDDADLVGAASLTTRVGNSIYAILLLYKKGQLWALIGSDPETMIGPLKIADIGLTAVETLAVIPSYEIGPGISRPIAVWQASDGIYMSDGFSVNLISGDIADRFDDRKSTCINRTYISSSFARYNEKYNEYCWNYAEGAATAPDQEWSYRFAGGKWYETDRTSAKRLKALIPVKDTSGNNYMYAAIAGGYMERLDNGTTFDGTNITFSFWPGDIAPHEGDLAVETKVRYIKHACVVNNTTENTIAVTHYTDGDTTGTTVNPIAPQKTGRRITQVVKSVEFDGVLHSSRFSITADSYEPLYTSYYYKPIRLDKGFSAGTPVS